jgi:hypothetical protein
MWRRRTRWRLANMPRGVRSGGAAKEGGAGGCGGGEDILLAYLLGFSTGPATGSVTTSNRLKAGKRAQVCVPLRACRIVARKVVRRLLGQHEQLECFVIGVSHSSTVPRNYIRCTGKKSGRLLYCTLHRRLGFHPRGTRAALEVKLHITTRLVPCSSQRSSPPQAAATTGSPHSAPPPH